MNSVELRVNGYKYGGWKRVSVTRSIESISGSFDLEVSARWAGQGKPWPIRKEDECWVILNGEGVIAGWIDRCAPSYDAQSHSLAVSGKDKSAAMVECSASLPRWEFRNVSLLTLARRLAEPFGVDVSMAAGATAPVVSRLSIDPGESAFGALERACRSVGLLPVADAGGGIVMAVPGAVRAVTSLVEGENILAASGDYDASGRYRTYRVLAQQAGWNELNGAEAASVVGSATDATVRRAERVLVIRAESGMTRAQAKRRAEWEATVRAARGDTAEVTVQDWTQGNGTLWPVNALVHVKSPYLEIDAEMLIASATYSLDDSSGMLTRLSLRRPDAYQPEPTVAHKGKPGSSPWAELARGV